MIKYKLLCDDFRKAAFNREMVAKKQNVTAYIEVETYLRGFPLNRLLPRWIPRGKLPGITKEDLRRAIKEMHEERQHIT